MLTHDLPAVVRRNLRLAPHHPTHQPLLLDDITSGQAGPGLGDEFNVIHGIYAFLQFLRLNALRISLIRYPNLGPPMIPWMARDARGYGQN